LKPGKVEKLQSQPIDEDLPGLGQHYCIPCRLIWILILNFLNLESKIKL